MRKTFENIIRQYSDDISFLDQLFVTVYLHSRGIYDVKNELIKSHLLRNDNELVLSLVNQLGSELSAGTLIELFEITISKNEQQINGSVYTPDTIKEYIVSSTFSKFSDRLNTILIADVSCGCGAFLYSSAKKLKQQTNKSYEDIFQQIYGLDISSNSVLRAKILLSLLAITEGEDELEYNFNLLVGNALEYDWFKLQAVKNNHGFDIVVGNPPYVRAKHIDVESKKLLKNWKVASSGNSDLYIPFFEIGVNLLNHNGVLGYITVNSFFKSVNARGLRYYMSENRFPLTIINFGHEQIFENRLTYTCLCFIDKKSGGNISYAKATGLDIVNDKQFNFSILSYSDLDHQRGWLLNNNRIISNIRKIENAGPSLDELYIIKNGIATLSNDVYIFKSIGEDDSNFFFIKDQKEYSIEKSICREIIKPNILKTESEIEEIKEKIIYPYTNGVAPLSLINEKKLKDEFPLAYNYLLDNKIQLDERDKGNGNYAAWYAFGRTQALNDKGLKLLFPYMAKKPHFVFTDNSEMLIYCGYAIFSESEEELQILKRILESDVFDYYMKNTSKPYSSGYYSYAKNYVKHFGICELSNSEKKELLSLNSKKKINEFVSDKYEIIIES